MSESEVGPSASDIAAATAEGLKQASGLIAAGELRQALAIVEPLAAQDLSNPVLHNTLGMVRAQMGELEGAETAFVQARTLLPDNASVLNNLASIYSRMRRWGEAEAVYTRILETEPGNESALLNYAQMLRDARRPREAIIRYQQLLDMAPEHEQALFNLGNVHEGLHEHAQAHALYARHLAYEPGNVRALRKLALLHYFLDVHDPRTLPAHAKALGAQLEAATPHFQGWPGTPEPERRLRIGLMSADLRDHPVGYFIEGLLGQAASRTVDWFAFHNDRGVSPLTLRIHPYFSGWHEVSSWSDRELIAMIRRERIDVLLDLTGLTLGDRLPVFAARPAPLQLSWMGYFGTTGLTRIDGVIADPHCVPPGEEAGFSESVLRMPHIRYCFTPAQDAPEVASLPALERGHITFGSFQQVSKISDTVLATWGRIARALPTAKWRLQAGGLSDAHLLDELRRRLAAHGLVEERVSLHESCPRVDYLAAHAEVDFLLDTFPYPGGTTTSEALWVGVPSLVLARPGMLGRQGEAINRVVGLDDWITDNEDAYVERAIHWASPQQWPALAKLRAGLRAHVAATPLFDQARFAEDWHALVRQAWRDRCARGWDIDDATEIPLPAPVDDSEALARALERARSHYRAGEYVQLKAYFATLAPALREQPDLLLLRGMLARVQEDYDEADRCIDAVLAARPGDIDALCEQGLLRRKRGQPEQGAATFREVLDRAPDSYVAQMNLGQCLLDMGEADQAIDCFREALRLSPNNIRAMFNVAYAHQRALRMEDACAHYEAALEVHPSDINIMANLLFLSHYRVPAYPQKISERARALGAQIVAGGGSDMSLAWQGACDPDKRLRIGLLTGDLRNHPVGLFIEGLLQDPQSRQVDWISYHNTHEKSALTHRIRPMFEAWHDVHLMSDAEVTQQVVRDRVDVLIDLSGHTSTHRLRVFTAKPAPLQLTWLGYFGTTGLACFDAIIADPHSVPVSEEGWYTEPVARLPHTRLNMAPPANAPEPAPLPALRKGFVTFGCFQNMAKINDAVLAVWGRIAREVPTARFRIQNGQVNTPRLLAEFRDRLAAVGLPPERVDCLPFTTHTRYFSDYAEVDLVLDTFCYPGGTTTAEALWMGVPTITYATPGMLGRQGEMLLSAAGLSDWITRSTQAYIDMAVHWAQPEQRAALAALRAGMRARVGTTPLFDQAGFARDWHSLVRELWRKACGKRWPAIEG